MATYRGEEDLLKTCPYDSNHRVAPKRFSIHVAQCARKSTKSLKICPFNSCHRIEPELYDAHLVSCQDHDPEKLTQMQRDLLEWEQIEPKKPTAAVNELVGRMGAIGITGPSTRQQSSPFSSEWDTEPVAEGYLIPGLENPNTEVSSAHGENTFHYQMLKPAEKRKLRERLVRETLERQREKEMAPIVEAAAEKERIEREKREKEKKEEQERFDKIKQNRENAKKAKEAKQKAIKEKQKAAKRAAFLAAQAEESAENKENTSEPDNHQE